VKTRFGIRECRFSPDEGFFLNGKHVKLHGSCNHQNHAGVGTAIPDSLQRWRLRKLKEAGCNAYRASHYPSTPELLDICDEEGILVLEENRYLSTSPGAMADMESMVRRDRNHPSVFLWSICNEEFLDTSEIGFRLATSQMARLKQLDSTRPVTAALILSSNGAGVDKATDVVAVNYRNEGWDDVHRHHPSQAIVVTESTALKSTRGIYNKDAAGRYIPAYDEVHDMFDLRTTVRRTCLDVQERPHIAGNFVWAGFNYRGEGGAWPRTCAQSGFLDLCGFPKDAFYLYQAFWTGKPMVHLLPHWNWPGKEGQAIRVVAYSNCERVELFLNGKSVGGEQAVPHDHMVEWSVPYQPGILRAEARRGGGIAIQAEVRTSGEPAGIRLSCNTETLRADIEDTAVVTVEIVDSEGTPVPTADILTRFTIEGPGMIIGTGNGDPTSLEPDKASQRTTFNALAQILIQTTGGAGDIVLTAAADRLSSATLKIAAAAAPRRPFLPGPASLQNVGNWRRSPFLDTAPDPSDPSYDPTAWEAFAQLSGFPSFLRQGQWTGYHAKLVIPKPGTWRLAFSRVHGAGAVFINGKQLCEIAQRTESFSVDLPDLPAGRGISLDLRLQNISGGAGLFGCVWLYETASQ
jgi:beta-galactosidase